MTTIRRDGLTVGILLLLQMGFGLITPFVLLDPATVKFPDYLITLAEHSTRVRTAVFISFVGSALTVAIAIAAWPVLRRYSERFALVLVAVCLVSCAMDLVQDEQVMSMLAMSERAVQGGSDSAIMQAIGGAVASSRKWAHYTQLLGFGVWIFTFYLSMLRFRLIPRVLSVLGMLGIISQFVGVTLLTFLGYSQVLQMAMPLAPIQVAAALWLIIKGFDEGELLAATTGEPAFSPT